jgi:hypothetical protein
MADEQWWYDLTTKSVVSDDNTTKAADRLGPYPSREAAEHALQQVEQRNEAYDNDPRWKD